MKKVKLGELLQKVFNFTERQIAESDSPETIPAWDSFQSLIMFQELEKATGLSFEIDELKDVKSVKGICALLDAHNIGYTL